MRVFTIPPSQSFLRTLITSLMDGRLVSDFSAKDSPDLLAQVTLYLPTRRACRLAAEVFVDVLGEATILPRILALGDIDEDELAFTDAAFSNIDALDLPPALNSLERRLQLAPMVSQWAAQFKPARDGDAPLVASGGATIFHLVDDLARLIDDMTTRNADWTMLDRLVPDDFAQYWQMTLPFLKIAGEAWPRFLHERGAMESAARRDALLRMEAARLVAQAPGPIIAAGSTGSMPSTADFLVAIAKLKQGAVVLPGLDTWLDEDSWSHITPRKDEQDADHAPSHPQYSLANLLARFGMTRADVISLAPPASHGREQLLSEAMRPASTTSLWQQRLHHIQHNGPEDAAITYIEAENAQEEALAIAVALRETVSQEQASAALVTPDRALARRVIAAASRWNLEIDDSGGDPLTQTAAGLIARLACDTLAKDGAPPSLLALLKHDDFRFGKIAGGYRAAIATLELAILRGAPPHGGWRGLVPALADFRTQWEAYHAKRKTTLHGSDPRVRLTLEEINSAQTLIVNLASAAEPFFAALQSSSSSLGNLAKLHRAFLECLTCEADGTPAIITRSDGAAMFAALADIDGLSIAHGITIASQDYPDILEQILAERAVRRAGRPGARLRIYGPLEARLTQHDRVILAGLSEEIWPPRTQSDAWLSRPMRQKLGLDLPERRIGLSAHDFVQLMGARDVILTRAVKVGTEPSVASRFIHRLEAVMGESAWQGAAQRGARYLRMARGLDWHARQVAKPIAAPTPKPPVSMRPQRMSVTDIAHLVRDPYTIFAKHVLRLNPLEPIDGDIGARDRGNAIHGALDEFTRLAKTHVPDDALTQLLRLGDEQFAKIEWHIAAQALWRQRFTRIAEWVIDWERSRRDGIARVFAEQRGQITFSIGARDFTLSARADRIELWRDGRLAILDYKTGSHPSPNEVHSGLEPQLTLEGAILRHGGFASINAQSASLSELGYVYLNGGNPAGEMKDIPAKVMGQVSSVDDMADHALNELTKLLKRFEDPDQPYRALISSQSKKRYGSYDNLSRVKEWSATGGADEDGES